MNAVKNVKVDDKKRFCSTGSHWVTGEFRKIGSVRWICMACYERRRAELRNLAKNKRLAASIRTPK